MAASRTSRKKKGRKTTRRVTARRHASRGLRFTSYLTSPGVDPLDEVEWETREASITNSKGEAIFLQKNVEVSADWSQTAINVVASKYFRGPDIEGHKESSIRVLIERVVDTITEWGRKDGIFATERDADTFEAELKAIVVGQMATFNSPVWFNVGIEEHPQASACFINQVDDTMDSIMELASIEATLFKGGSGTGTNFSSIRSSKEPLSGGGQASGPVSFMRGFDAFAGVIKSGGKTRRAAKMVILNIDHPDIEEFINSKTNEEKKAWSLIDSGYDGSLNGEAYSSVFFQNANNSVRVSDEFMNAVVEDDDWNTVGVTTGEVHDTFKARKLFSEIAEAAHMCGDPGLQFDTTINDWHTCPNDGRIEASNPCSEFMFLNNTSCNLASVNLMRFLNEDGTFDTETFRHVVDTVITAQEIIVDNARYPTATITEMSHRYRPLGIGYANLGALLMARGLPYDSDDGRNYAASVSALLTGEAYAQSARIARSQGPFEAYERNTETMLGVIDKHIDALDEQDGPEEILSAAAESWGAARSAGEKYGFRNAQASVLAPTGTIAFMMDCDTTGIEPDIALIKHKKLVGGGTMRIVNQTVPLALSNLGYDEATIKEIKGYIDRKGTIEGCEQIDPEHLPVFDCALQPVGGTRYIEPMGHINMMGAVQPFISGAISKTVNIPHQTTIEQIEQIYLDAWKSGLKSLAVYRDGSKRTQPLETGTREERKNRAPRPYRRRLPDERPSITHKFTLGGHEGYLTVGMYPDGQPGEIFIKMAKVGSTISGLMDSFALAISMTLQYGVPLSVLVEKFTHTRFEPAGYTNNPDVPIAKSIMDYIFQYLSVKFLAAKDPDVENHMEGSVEFQAFEEAPEEDPDQLPLFDPQADAPACADCGAIMTRSGACYKCENCGSTSGCS
ncbi:MAG: vitamin B12-dependent ribonucleotide reductase [Deltaproteobacteria bacterium]|nr:vitamin B12-dependent ribonucleotide reductase [Deltaproteobacteria bacterium]